MNLRDHLREAHDNRSRHLGAPPVPPQPPVPEVLQETHRNHSRHLGSPPVPPSAGAAADTGRRGPGRGRRSVRSAVLALLTERPMHGYEMIQEIDARTGGVWRPSPGSVYPTLQMLEDEGLVVGATQTSGAGRRRYSLSPAGRAEAAEAARSAPWSGLAEETVNGRQEIRDAGAQAMEALRQVTAIGTDDQRQRAVQVLDETRRRLYAILAEPRR